MRKWLRGLPPGARAGAIVILTIVSAFAACILGWFGYAAVAWVGYGRLGVDRRADPLLDRFMPTYEVAERHEIRVAAPAAQTYAAECDIDFQRSAAIRAIFRSRELLLGAAPDAAATPSPFLAQALSMGWGILAQRPGRELVMGAITQPWLANVVFRSLPPDRFADFHTPDYVKITWTLEAEPVNASTSIARTVTRVQTTDPQSRAKFRRYWATFSPGILLIRYQALGLVRADAEERYQRDGAIGPSRCPETTFGHAAAAREPIQ